MGDVQWLPSSIVTQKLLDDRYYPEDRDKGLVLEVNLDYPDELHDLHNSHPLAPIKSTIPYDTFSPYLKKLAERLNAHDKTEKLYFLLSQSSAKSLTWLKAKEGSLCLRIHRENKGERLYKS